MNLTLIESPTNEEKRFIDDRLLAFNRSRIDGYGYDPFICRIDDDAGGTIAALHGEIGGGWLYIVGLWVDAAHRRQGLGTSLLAAAEEKGRQQGCRGAYLFSYSFQAPGFYAQNGYEPFGALEDFCGGHAKIFMKKSFA